MRITRKGLLAGMGAALAPGRRAWAAAPAGLTRVDPSWVVSEAEAIAWHKAKVENGPALTGNASWRRFLELLEGKLKAYGCVDVHRAPWTFRRMESSVWPDDSGWSLEVDGRRVPLANFGANCGLTGPEGVTAEMVLWDPAAKPDVEGRIVVFRPVVRPEVRDAFSNSDYEVMTPFDSWPVEGEPVPQEQDATHSIAAPVWDEMTQTSAFVREIQAARPAGVVFAMNLNRAATAGLYTFPVPELYDFPSVYVDRTAGDALIAAIGGGRRATMRVEGRYVESEAYQLVACLPGRDYGTAADQQVQLRTHTDGPSISQDDGAFGLLGVVKYMAHAPRAERPRTLLIELDCRHFMPGAERAWAAQDYFEKNPRARDKVVAMIAMEHLGQIDYVADGEAIRPSGRSLPTWIYATTNPTVIDMAFKAAKDNRIRSAIIRSPGRPGVHGRSQGPWYGMGGGARYLGIPAYGVQGDLGAYWAHSAGLDRFDARSFCRQVAAFAQLTGFLMASDLAPLQAPKVERPPPGAPPRR
jgi:hypothetical protein